MILFILQGIVLCYATLHGIPWTEEPTPQLSYNSTAPSAGDHQTLYYLDKYIDETAYNQGADHDVVNSTTLSQHLFTQARNVRNMGRPLARDVSKSASSDEDDDGVYRRPSFDGDDGFPAGEKKAEFSSFLNLVSTGSTYEGLSYMYADNSRSIYYGDESSFYMRGSYADTHRMEVNGENLSYGLPEDLPRLQDRLKAINVEKIISDGLKFEAEKKRRQEEEENAKKCKITFFENHVSQNADSIVASQAAEANAETNAEGNANRMADSGSNSQIADSIVDSMVACDLSKEGLDQAVLANSDLAKATVSNSNLSNEVGFATNLSHKIAATAKSSPSAPVGFLSSPGVFGCGSRSDTPVPGSTSDIIGISSDSDIGMSDSSNRIDKYGYDCNSGGFKIRFGISKYVVWNNGGNQFNNYGRQPQLEDKRDKTEKLLKAIEAQAEKEYRAISIEVQQADKDLNALNKEYIQFKKNYDAFKKFQPPFEHTSLIVLPNFLLKKQEAELLIAEENRVTMTQESGRSAKEYEIYDGIGGDFGKVGGVMDEEQKKRQAKRQAMDEEEDNRNQRAKMEPRMEKSKEEARMEKSKEEAKWLEESQIWMVTLAEAKSRFEHAILEEQISEELKNKIVKDCQEALEKINVSKGGYPSVLLKFRRESVRDVGKLDCISTKGNSTSIQLHVNDPVINAREMRRIVNMEAIKTRTLTRVIGPAKILKLYQESGDEVFESDTFDPENFLLKEILSKLEERLVFEIAAVPYVEDGEIFKGGISSSSQKAVLSSHDEGGIYNTSSTRGKCIRDKNIKKKKVAQFYNKATEVFFSFEHDLTPFGYEKVVRLIEEKGEFKSNIKYGEKTTKEKLLDYLREDNPTIVRESSIFTDQISGSSSDDLSDRSSNLLSYLILIIKIAYENVAMENAKSEILKSKLKFIVDSYRLPQKDGILKINQIVNLGKPTKEQDVNFSKVANPKFLAGDAVVDPRFGKLIIDENTDNMEEIVEDKKSDSSDEESENNSSEDDVDMSNCVNKTRFAIRNKGEDDLEDIDFDLKQHRLGMIKRHHAILIKRCHIDHNNVMIDKNNNVMNEKSNFQSDLQLLSKKASIILNEAKQLVETFTRVQNYDYDDSDDIVLQFVECDDDIFYKSIDLSHIRLILNSEEKNEKNSFFSATIPFSFEDKESDFLISWVDWDCLGNSGENLIERLIQQKQSHIMEIKNLNNQNKIKKDYISLQIQEYSIALKIDLRKRLDKVFGTDFFGSTSNGLLSCGNCLFNRFTTRGHTTISSTVLDTSTTSSSTENDGSSYRCNDNYDNSNGAKPSYSIAGNLEGPTPSSNNDNYDTSNNHHSSSSNGCFHIKQILQLIMEIKWDKPTQIELNSINHKPSINVPSNIKHTQNRLLLTDSNQLRDEKSTALLSANQPAEGGNLTLNSVVQIRGLNSQKYRDQILNLLEDLNLSFEENIEPFQTEVLNEFPEFVKELEQILDMFLVDQTTVDGNGKTLDGNGTTLDGIGNVPSTPGKKFGKKLIELRTELAEVAEGNLAQEFAQKLSALIEHQLEQKLEQNRVADKAVQKNKIGLLAPIRRSPKKGTEGLKEGLPAPIRSPKQGTEGLKEIRSPKKGKTGLSMLESASCWSGCSNGIFFSKNRNSSSDNSDYSTKAMIQNLDNLEMRRIVEEMRRTFEEIQEMYDQRVVELEKEMDLVFKHKEEELIKSFEENSINTYPLTSFEENILKNHPKGLITNKRGLVFTKYHLRTIDLGDLNNLKRENQKLKFKTYPIYKVSNNKNDVSYSVWPKGYEHWDYGSNRRFISVDLDGEKIANEAMYIRTEDGLKRYIAFHDYTPYILAKPHKVYQDSQKTFTIIGRNFHGQGIQGIHDEIGKRSTANNSTSSSTIIANNSTLRQNKKKPRSPEITASYTDTLNFGMVHKDVVIYGKFVSEFELANGETVFYDIPVVGHRGRSKTGSSFMEICEN